MDTLDHDAEQRARLDEATLALEAVRVTARDETTNLLVPMREALRARCTIGEISNVLRDEFGTYDAHRF